MLFVATHYPEHYSNAVDLLIWLYDMGAYREDREFEKAFSQPPGGKKSKQTAKSTSAPTATGKKGKKEVVEYSSEEEDTTFGYQKKAAKKPAPKPQMPTMGGKAMTEEQREA